jgi:hypothetical protein
MPFLLRVILTAVQNQVKSVGAVSTVGLQEAGFFDMIGSRGEEADVVFLEVCFPSLLFGEACFCNILQGD